MEIKRKFEMLIETKRRFIVRHSQNSETFQCGFCGCETLTAEKTAVSFDINQRFIFQLIEKSLIHFNETENGAVMVCLSSLASVLDKNFPEND